MGYSLQSVQRFTSESQVNQRISPYKTLAENFEKKHLELDSIAVSVGKLRVLIQLYVVMKPVPLAYSPKVSSHIPSKLIMPLPAASVVRKSAACFLGHFSRYGYKACYQSGALFVVSGLDSSTAV